MAVALRRHENKGIKDSVGTMAVKKQERRIEKYLDIDRSIETIGLRTRSGLRAGLPYSNKNLSSSSHKAFELAACRYHVVDLHHIPAELTVNCPWAYN